MAEATERYSYDGEDLSRIDCFAEMLSRDVPRSWIEQAMNISRGQYDGILRRLRKAMGDQAQ